VDWGGRQALLGWLLMVDLPRTVDAEIRIGYSMFSDIVKRNERNYALVKLFGKKILDVASGGITAPF
jgi:hypothetical protein